MASYQKLQKSLGASTRVALEAVVEDLGHTLSRTFLDCHLLNMKSYDRPLMKTLYKMESSKGQEYIYHKLFIMADIVSCKPFFIFTETDAEYNNLIAFWRERKLIGTRVVLYRPRFDGDFVHGIPVILASDPFIPVTTFVDDESTFKPKYHSSMTGRKLQPFYFRTDRIKLNDGRLVHPTCGSLMCDAKHFAVKKECPATARKLYNCHLKVRVVLTTDRAVHPLNYSSYSLARCIATEDALDEHDLEDDEVTDKVKEFAMKANKSGGFYVLGYTIQPYTRSDGTMQERTIVICDIRPAGGTDIVDKLQGTSVANKIKAKKLKPIEADFGYFDKRSISKGLNRSSGSLQNPGDDQSTSQGRKRATSQDLNRSNGPFDDFGEDQSISQGRKRPLEEISSSEKEN